MVIVVLLVFRVVVGCFKQILITDLADCKFKLATSDRA